MSNNLVKVWDLDGKMHEVLPLNATDLVQHLGWSRSATSGNKPTPAPAPEPVVEEAAPEPVVEEVVVEEETPEPVVEDEPMVEEVTPEAAPEVAEAPVEVAKPKKRERPSKK